jgi:hypothetical protein
MEIFISDMKTLCEVQAEFNKEFPYLKIEFFQAPYIKNRALPRSKMFDNNRKISASRRIHTEGKLKFDTNETVADLEQAFWDKFGLSVQVFRKSGTLWIETSLTDSWTLERQNKEGREFSPQSAALENVEQLDPSDRDKWQ